MVTKYGTIDSQYYNKYLSLLRKQIWKLIPLKQEDCLTINSYIDRINRTLFGLIHIYESNTDDIMTIMNLLENAKFENDFKNYRSDILKCCRILLDIIEKDGDSDV